MTTNKTTSHSDDDLGQRIHDASERLVDIKDEVAKTIDRRVKTLGTLMKEHPLAALAAGIGLGYLIARLVHR